MAYDVDTEMDPVKVRGFMKNAKKDRKNDEAYWKGFNRLCLLAGIDQEDPLGREFYQTLAAYEELLTIKNGRKTRASYTRRKL